MKFERIESDWHCVHLWRDSGVYKLNDLTLFATFRQFLSDCARGNWHKMGSLGGLDRITFRMDGANEA